MTKRDEVVELDARVDKGTLVVPSLFLAFFTALFAIGARGRGEWPVLVGVVAFWVLLTAYLLAYRVVVSKGRLTKQTLFGRVEFPLAEVARIGTPKGRPRGLEVLLPPVRVEIECKQRKKNVTINLKMLRSADVRQLLLILARAAEVSDVGPNVR